MEARPTTRRAPRRPPPQLPTAIQLYILSLLPPNERTLSGRFVSRDTAEGLSSLEDRTASVSQPLPSHAVPWALAAGQQHMRQLPYCLKPQLLCKAAASGSETNLQCALHLLHATIFPELLTSRKWVKEHIDRGADPGVAAVKAGHPQLLGWLLHHCPALLNYGRVLRAAARRCDLAGLQAVWEALRDDSSRPRRERAVLDQDVLDAAAASATPDAIAKMEWVLAKGRRACSLDVGVAHAAARSGDLARLRWLRGRGCPMADAESSALESALQYADLAVAQWLVDVAGCRLPRLGRVDIAEWRELLEAAARSVDGVAKMEWLQQRGAPLSGPDNGIMICVGVTAIEEGTVEVVRYLQSVAAMDEAGELQEDVAQAIEDGKPRSVAMAEHLRAAGREFEPKSYAAAAKASNLDMFRWLALEAEVSAEYLFEIRLDEMIQNWSQSSAADSRDLLEAVQLLVGTAGFEGWDAKLAVRSAIARGDLALVRYLLQQQPGYQLDGKAVEGAAKAGCEALLEWLVEQQPRCLAGPWVVSPYVRAAANGDRATLEALRRLGVLRGAHGVARAAIKEGCELPALRWLLQAGAGAGMGSGGSDHGLDGLMQAGVPLGSGGSGHGLDCLVQAGAPLGSGGSGHGLDWLVQAGASLGSGGSGHGLGWLMQEGAPMGGGGHDHGVHWLMQGAVLCMEQAMQAWMQGIIAVARLADGRG